MTNAGIVSAVFIFLLVFLANPFGWWMPTELEYIAVASLAVVAAIFAGIIVGEKAHDEREEALRADAARIGYLFGIGTLTVGIAINIFMGMHTDPFILIALGVMVASRFVARKHSE